MAVPAGTTASGSGPLVSPGTGWGCGHHQAITGTTRWGLLGPEKAQHRGIQKRQVSLGFLKALEASCLEVTRSQGPKGPL